MFVTGLDSATLNMTWGNATSPLGTSWSTAPQTSITVLISLTVLVGNAVSIAVTPHVPDLSDSTKVLMTSLAVVDFAIGILSLLSAVALGLDSWPYGDVFCDVYAILGMSCTLLSVELIMFLNVERYIATTRPYRFPVWCSKRRAVLSVLVAFVTCIVIPLTLWLVADEENPAYYIQSVGICFINNKHTLYNVLYLFLFDLIPVAVMVLIYWRLVKISREHELRANRNGVNNNNNNIRNNKALRAFLMVTVLFAVCWTPSLITRIVQFAQNAVISDLAEYATWQIATCNSLVNVFIYCVSFPSFRQTAKRMTRKLLPRSGAAVMPQVQV